MFSEHLDALKPIEACLGDNMVKIIGLVEPDKKKEEEKKPEEIRDSSSENSV